MPPDNWQKEAAIERVALTFPAISLCSEAWLLGFLPGSCRKFDVKIKLRSITGRPGVIMSERWPGAQPSERP